MRDLALALADLESATISRRSDLVSAVASELEFLALEVDVLPDAFVDGVAALLRDDAFLAIKDSWKVVFFLYNNWQQVSLQQRERLRPVLHGSFDAYDDWMGAFVTAEILGDRFCDEAALQALLQLSTGARLPHRACVPHGFELLARTTSDEVMRAAAVKRIQELTTDTVEEVRSEAEQSLRRVSQVRRGHR